MDSVVLTDSDIRDSHGVWLDISSLLNLISTDALWKAKKKGQSRDDCTHSADQLARLVAYDRVFLEASGLDHLEIQIPQDLAFCFGITLSSTVYFQALKHLEGALDICELSNFDSSILPTVFGYNSVDHDSILILEKLSTSRLLQNFRWGPNLISPNLRSMLYLEVARVTGHTVVLSENKKDFLRSLGKAVPRDCLSEVEKIAESLFGSCKLSPDAPPNFFSADVGPLGEYVLRVAQDKGCSPIQALNEVREMPDCVRFRACFRELDYAVRKGREAAKELVKIESEMRSAADLWKNKPAWGRRTIQNKVNLGGVPLIGSLLKSIGRDIIKVPDIELCRKPSGWCFIGHWYSETGSGCK